MGRNASETALKGDTAKKLQGNLEINPADKYVPPTKDELCIDSTTLSYQHWKAGFDHGYLSKGSYNKYKEFSYVREAPRRYNYGDCVLSSRTSDPKQTAEKPDADYPKYEEPPVVVDRFGPVSFSTKWKSMAVLEDFSTPPEAPGDVIPLSFTIEEFLSFMHSPDWGGGGNNKMLRVINGPVLHRLQTALHALEARGVLYNRSTRAFLNNGYWSQPPANELANNERTAETKKEPDWTKEKILVDMFYYGKVPASSAPDIQCSNGTVHKPTRESHKAKIIPTAELSIKHPVFYYMYPVERLKLPPGISYDPEAKIAKLQSEEDELYEKKAKEKDKENEAANGTGKKDAKKDVGGKKANDDPSADNNTKSTKGKKGSSGDSTGSAIEDIAEDPYIVKETIAQPEEVKADPSVIKPAKSVSSVRIRTPGSILEEAEVINEAEEDVTEPVTMEEVTQRATKSIMTAPATRPTPDPELSRATVTEPVTRPSTFFNSFEQELDPAEKPALSALSFSHILPEGFRSAESIYTDQRSEPSSTILQRRERKEPLYLSGQELYISSLYSEKEYNARTAAEKLIEANRTLLKNKSEVTKKMYQHIYESRTFDIETRFKRLVNNKEEIRRKATAPKAQQNKSLKVNKRTNAPLGPWSKYIIGQEELEMMVATRDDFPPGFMKRLLAKPPQEQQQQKDDDAKKGKEKPKGRTNNNLRALSPANSNQNRNQRTTLKSKFKPGVIMGVETRAILLKQSLLNLDNFDRNNNSGEKFEDEVAPSNRVNRMDRPSSVKSKSGTLRSTRKSVRFQDLEDDDETDNKTETRPSESTASTCKHLPPIPKGSQSNTSTSFLTRARIEEHNRIISKTSVNDRIMKSLLRKSAPSSSVNIKMLNKLQTLPEIPTEDSNRNSLQSAKSSEISAEDWYHNEDNADGHSLSHTDNELNSEHGHHDHTAPHSIASEIASTDWETVNEKLSKYHLECDCLECIDDKLERFQVLQPDCLELPFTYPVKLGCLEKLKKPPTCTKNDASCCKSEIKPTVYHQEYSDEYLRDMLLQLMDKMVIRKEIIVSSLGKPFTSLVFIGARNKEIGVPIG